MIDLSTLKDENGKDISLEQKAFLSLRPIAEIGSLATIEEFTQRCKEGWFSDWDGHGHFCNERGLEREKEYVFPTMLLAGMYKTEKKYIIWYNK